MVVVGYDIDACYEGWTAAHNADYQTVTIVCFAATIILNWYCTSLIIGRIWWVARRTERVAEVNRSRSARYGNVVRTLVESGFLYSFVMGAYLICTIVNSVSISLRSSGSSLMIS